MPRAERPVDAMLPPSSLIIPSRNRPSLLADTVRSVLAAGVVPSEIVIVDQSDGDVPFSPPPDERCTIRHVKSQPAGLSRARNEGIAAAQHDLLAFLDDDMLVGSGWYAALIRPLVAVGRRTVVTGAVHPGVREVAGGFTPATVTRSQPEIHQGRIGTDVLAGGNMALWRAALIEVGPFDERLGPGSPWASAEDNDLGFRLLEAGFRIHYVPEAVVYHRAWRPARDYYRLRWTYGLGKGGFYVKHGSWRDRYTWRRASADIGSRLIGFPARFIRDRRRGAGDLVYAAGVAWGVARWVAMESRATPRIAVTGSMRRM